MSTNQIATKLAKAAEKGQLVTVTREGGVSITGKPVPVEGREGHYKLATGKRGRPAIVTAELLTNLVNA